MYELFILGELMDKPMHGYLLQYVLDKVIGPNRKISWGVLYPLIQRMSEDDYIELTMEEDGGRGRPKKIISLTEQGRSRFYELMEKSIPFDQTTEDLFDIKLSNFHHISKEIKLLILEQFEGYIEYLNKHLDENQTIINEQATIATIEKHSIERVLDHRREKLEAELNWLNRQIESIREDNDNE